MSPHLTSCTLTLPSGLVRSPPQPLRPRLRPHPPGRQRSPRNRGPRWHSQGLCDEIPSGFTSSCPNHAWHPLLLRRPAHPLRALCQPRPLLTIGTPIPSLWGQRGVKGGIQTCPAPASQTPLPHRLPVPPAPPRSLLRRQPAVPHSGLLLGGQPQLLPPLRRGVRHPLPAPTHSGGHPLAHPGAQTAAASQRMFLITPPPRRLPPWTRAPPTPGGTLRQPRPGSGLL